MSTKHLQTVLDEAKKAVQKHSSQETNGFVHLVEHEGQVYLVAVEKYVPDSEKLKKVALQMLF